MTYEASQPPAELVLPDNIHDLLDSSLESAKDHGLIHIHGANTLLYVVQGYPELFVRHNSGLDVGEAKESLKAVHRLQEQGIDVLPAEAVGHGGETFVVTKKVDGRPLVDLLVDDVDEPLRARLGGIWAGLAENLMDSRQKGLQISMDVAHPEQYMVGTMAGEAQPRIWLVDLPEWSFSAKDIDDYLEHLLNVANGVAAVQELTGTQLNEAQTVLEEAVTAAEDSDEYGDAVANAIRRVVATNVTLDLESQEDKILELRTR